ncbi:MAG: undecaprenyldiphospho-muramoylpentapeptide beta-N-acetylglucosaminyltransferase [Limnochordaceae bacterium]|nr:undecaprenyldiphospho-muramoylpentapeptide beta-N-acetylglucosaminyltransferase [Limnochordaceae bacterium]
MRVVLTGGGTGGHIYPALGVAEAWRAQDPGVELFYVGTRRGLESRLVPPTGIPFYTLSSRPFLRTRPWTAVEAALSAGWGVVEALRLLHQLRPDLVLATGGYVCGPLALAAARHRIPLVLQEQNSVPGRTSRYLARYARKIALGFEQARRHFPARLQDRIVVTGNPVRPEVLAADRQASQAKLGLNPARRTLLVTGGSQGAATLNQALLTAYPRLAQRRDLQILWHTGDRPYAAVRQALAGERWQALTMPGGAQAIRQGNCTLVSYLYDMPAALAAADLVVSRAGALSLAEILVRGIPSILVPYPFAADDHQYKNAEVLVTAGAARLVPDAECDGDRLLQEVQALLDSERLREQMHQAALRLARPRATQEIIAVARSVV